jgi:hypothetical protein
MAGFYDSNRAWRETATGYIELPRGNWTLLVGTALAAFSGGASATPGYATDGSEAGGVRWNNNGSHDEIVQPLLFPADRKPGTDVTLNVLASKTGATAGDTVDFVCAVFFYPVGAVRDPGTDVGGAMSSLTGDATTKTVQLATRTIASAGIPDGPVPMTISLVPTSAKLGTDDVTIHAAYLSYERVLPPA